MLFAFSEICYFFYVWCCLFFFFKQKTAYDMRISDWSSDVCSSDLDDRGVHARVALPILRDIARQDEAPAADRQPQLAVRRARFRKADIELAADARFRPVTDTCIGFHPWRAHRRGGRGDGIAARRGGIAKRAPAVENAERDRGRGERRCGHRHCHQEREAPPPHRVSFARLGPLCKHGLHPPTRALRKVDIFRGQNRGANRLRRSVPQGLFPRKAQGWRIRMKATIERAVLLKSLGHVQSVVERRNTIPILSNVLIEADASGQLKLMATDLDLQVVETIAAKVETPGTTTVSAQTLFEIARKLPEGSEVSLAAAEGKMQVKAGRSNFNLPTLPPDDFPVIAEGELPHN